jgi:hypothetical protein
VIEEPPPLLGSWRNLYALVLGNLVFLVLVFWLLTRMYG